MQWWYWPLGGLLFCLILIGANQWTAMKKIRLHVLDVITLPVWVIAHYTMGYALGVSYIEWILLSWFAFGAILAWFLLQKNGIGAIFGIDIGNGVAFLALRS